MLRRTRFNPTPRHDAGYAQSRRFLRSAFGTWSEETASPFGPDCFEELIYYKWGHLDRHLTRWRAADRDALCSHLEHISGRFRRRMAERSRYSPGKRFWLAAAAAGVDIEDDKAIAAFVEQFNARPDAERGSVLGQPSTAEPGPREGGRSTPPGTGALGSHRGLVPVGGPDGSALLPATSRHLGACGAEG